jgi:hypothetical protein
MNAPHASEQHIHACIATFLNRALPEGSLHFAIDSAGKASLAIAQRLKARGGMRGVADHFLAIPGKPSPIWLEVKAPKGVVSPAQEHFAACVSRHGHAYYVVRSVEDAEYALRLERVPLRATVSGIRASIAAQNEGLRPLRKRAAGGKPRAARPTPGQVRRAEANRWLP